LTKVIVWPYIIDKSAIQIVTRLNMIVMELAVNNTIY
jgi:hypothetical protein